MIKVSGLGDFGERNDEIRVNSTYMEHGMMGILAKVMEVYSCGRVSYDFE